MSDSGQEWRQDAVRTLFNPRNIAVIGANPSHHTRKNFLENLAAGGFDGSAFGVARQSYEGPFPYVQSLRDVPVTPDVVLIALRSDRIPEAVEEAASIGAKAAILFDGGFADVGPAGKRLQDQISEMAVAAGMALAGPNCYGVANLVDKVALFSQPIHFDRPRGNFGIVSCSGGVMDAVLASSPRLGVRWGFLAATGNEAVLGAADFLLALAHEPRCSGIATFLEAVRDPETLFEACDVASANRKPLVVLRVGRTERSRDAAAAHSGALAPPSRLLDSKLKRHGAIVVDSVSELVATMSVLQSGRVPKGPGVGVLSSSGGLNELTHESIPGTSVTFPELGSETVSKLSKVLGPYNHKTNPLDWAPSPMNAIPTMLDAMLNDPAIDSIAFFDFLGFPGVIGDSDGAAFGLDAACEAVGRHDKLLVLVDPGFAPESVVTEAAKHEVPVLIGVDTAMRALGHAIDFGQARRIRDVSSDATSLFRPGERVPVSGLPALELVGRYANIVESHTASSRQEALDAARALGYPVVLKIGDESIVHKTEHDGIVLNLSTADQVAAAADRILKFSDSVLIQPQVSGVELMCGVHYDDALGGFVMIGLGGVWTELFDDVAIRPLGIDDAEARLMLDGLQARQILGGYRNTPPVNLEEVIRLLLGVDRLGRDLAGLVRSIDINPVMATTQAAHVVDAAFVVADGPQQDGPCSSSTLASNNRPR